MLTAVFDPGTTDGKLQLATLPTRPTHGPPAAPPSPLPTEFNFDPVRHCSCRVFPLPSWLRFAASCIFTAFVAESVPFLAVRIAAAEGDRVGGGGGERGVGLRKVGPRAAVRRQQRQQQRRRVVADALLPVGRGSFPELYHNPTIIMTMDGTLSATSHQPFHCLSLAAPPFLGFRCL